MSKKSIAVEITLDMREYLSPAGHCQPATHPFVTELTRETVHGGIERS
jgi:hypothetical protein